MRTPAGNECPYFYGNYFRGHKQEECRLIGEHPAPNNWSPDLCRSCPVPGIVRANSWTNMVLKAEIKQRFLGLKREVKVTAHCKLIQGIVTEPYIGCGQCHPLPPVFEEEVK